MTLTITWWLLHSHEWNTNRFNANMIAERTVIKQHWDAPLMSLKPLCVVIQHNNLHCSCYIGSQILRTISTVARLASGEPMYWFPLYGSDINKTRYIFKVIFHQVCWHSRSCYHGEERKGSLRGHASARPSNVVHHSQVTAQDWQ